MFMVFRALKIRRARRILRRDFLFFRDTFCSQNVWILRKKKRKQLQFFLEKMRHSRDFFQKKEQPKI